MHQNVLIKRELSSSTNDSHWVRTLSNVICLFNHYKTCNQMKKELPTPLHWEGSYTSKLPWTLPKLILSRVIFFQLYTIPKSSPEVRARACCALKQALQCCLHRPALEPLLHAAPACILKYVLAQYAKVLFNQYL